MRIFIVILAAVGIGVGMGFTRTSMELGGVKEKFTVSREILDTSANNRPTSSTEGSAEAQIPVANLMENPTFDFGSMEKGTVQDHSFWFKNEGTGILEITLLRTSCKCTLSDLKGKTKKIAPGKTAAVKLTYESDDYSKRFRTSATLQTNDPARATIDLFVEGRVVQPVRPEPSNIVFSSIKTNKASESRLRIYAYKTKNPDKQAELKINKTSFDSNKNANEFFNVDVAEMDATELELEKEAEYGYILTVKAKEGLPIGPIKQMLTVATTRGDLEIPIEGKVTGDFSFSVINPPGQVEYRFDDEKNVLRFGTIQGNADAYVDLVLIANTDKSTGEIEIKIDDKEILPSAKHIKAELQKDKFAKFGTVRKYVVRVTVPKDCPNVNLLGPDQDKMGKLVIRTTHPTAKTINIYVDFAKVQ